MASHEHVVRPLREVVDLHRQAGRTPFLVVATTKINEEPAGVIDAVGADRGATVLLMASPEIVAMRIDAREPDTWLAGVPGTLIALNAGAADWLVRSRCEAISGAPGGVS